MLFSSWHLGVWNEWHEDKRKPQMQKTLRWECWICTHYLIICRRVVNSKNDFNCSLIDASGYQYSWTNVNSARALILYVIISYSLTSCHICVWNSLELLGCRELPNRFPLDKFEWEC